LLSPTDGANITDYSPTLDWTDVTNADYYQVQVDNASDFSSPDRNGQPTTSAYTITPDLAGGTWFWRARTNVDSVFGDWSAGWQFILPVPPSPPTLVSPPNGATISDYSPLLDWSDVSGADSYQVQVDSNSNFDSPERAGTVTSSQFTVTPDLVAGTWYWRVRTFDNSVYGNWSVSWNFILSSLLIPPTLLSPANGTTIGDYSPLLDWSDVAGADSYQVHVDNSSGFSSPDRNRNILASSYTVSPDLAGGTWYWRVRTYDGSNVSNWSAVWNFILPGVPNLLSPANGSTTYDRTPTFDWSDIQNRTSYRIQVDNNSNFGSPEINWSVGPSTYTPPSNLPVGLYYWRVRAAVNNVPGNWSTVFRVTIRSSTNAGVAGDINGSGRADGNDLNYLTSYLKGKHTSVPCLPCADVDGSGEIDGADVQYLREYLKGQGSVPVMMESEGNSDEVTDEAGNPGTLEN
jgi:hypothetical protein